MKTKPTILAVGIVLTALANGFGAARYVNVPEVTVIDGNTSVRCVYLTNSAVLIGFTLTNGYAHKDTRMRMVACGANRPEPWSSIACSAATRLTMAAEHLAAR